MDNSSGDIVGRYEGEPRTQGSDVADTTGPRGAGRLLAKVEPVDLDDLRPVNGVSEVGLGSMKAETEPAATTSVPKDPKGDWYIPLGPVGLHHRPGSCNPPIDQGQQE